MKKLRQKGGPLFLEEATILKKNFILLKQKKQRKNVPFFAKKVNLRF